jgi:uncharacterized protein YecE (DUF72 family)
MAHPIHIGIGGWSYEPWQGSFYPEKLARAKELEYAASRLTSIEINSTYYSSQKPESFAKWAAATPKGFVFTAKASRYATNRRVLAEAGPSVEKFVQQGITRLGDRLGPILWQFMPTKKFDADDFGAFLKLLPKEQDGLKLRHAVEVRHESFACDAFAELARKHRVAVVYADHESYPLIDVHTAGFTYVRLQQSREDEPAGYSEAELDEWAQKVHGWAKDREVFLYFISGAKVRNPFAAQALISRLSG